MNKTVVRIKNLKALAFLWDFPGDVLFTGWLFVLLKYMQITNLRRDFNCNAMHLLGRSTEERFLLKAEGAT